MPIESFLDYIRYEKNLSTHTVLSYRNDLFQFKKFLETECDGIEMQKPVPGQFSYKLFRLSTVQFVAEYRNDAWEG